MVELAPVRSRIGESMEDRHLYRGKRTLTDNMWVYWDGFSGVQPNTVIEEETICQCTGLKDKNGKLILRMTFFQGISMMSLQKMRRESVSCGTKTDGVRMSRAVITTRNWMILIQRILK